MADVDVSLALHVRAEHSESPVWDWDAGCLWWVDITGRRVHRFDPESGQDCSWGTSGQPGGVVLGVDGQVVVGLPDGLALLDDSGATTLVVPIEADLPGNRSNDLKADRSGRVWVGTMAYDRTPGAGALYCVADGEPQVAVADLTISNGPAIDGRDGRLYFADTMAMVVDVCDFDADSGSLSARRRFLDFGDEKVWPDGMTVDAEGCLWLALGRSGSVRRYRPDGRLDGVVEVPVSNPTSVAFGGTGGSDLFIATSWFDLTPEQREEQPLAGAVFSCRPGVSGVPAERAMLTSGE
ncbi:MAG: SMP-30/gluconolactonase/LRE family protein [Actinobacteria bacterium]|nr:SMP-30/gluconolactonase/LRE family protein [Actinomycetota bacterium]MCB9412205.1 SMP-30/gluconolactonase/LRE family protein [Actinomycetota bacterium]